MPYIDTKRGFCIEEGDKTGKKHFSIHPRVHLGAPKKNTAKPWGGKGKLAKAFKDLTSRRTDAKTNPPNGGCGERKGSRSLEETGCRLPGSLQIV